MAEKDSLALLREYYLQGKEVKVDGNDLVFGEIRLPKSSDTSFKKSKGKGPPYTLEAVWFFMVCLANKTPQDQYIRKCHTEGIPFISAVDRRILQSHFESETPIEPTVEAAEPAVESSAITEKPLLPQKRPSSVLEPSALEPSTKKLTPNEVTALIKEREHPLRTRLSVLQAPNKKFTQILDAANKLKRQEEEEKKRADKKRHEHDRHRTQSHTQSLGDGMDFNIDTRGTFADVLQGKKKPEPPTSRPSSSASSSSSSSSSSSRSGSSRSSSSSSSSISPVPIIIVPTAMTSMITINNAKDFLEKGVYSPSVRDGVKPSVVSFVCHKPDGTVTKVEILDNPTKLPPRDWERVVAVFTNGAAWQFKGWPWPTPVDVFSRVKGFYVTYDDQTIPEVVQSWNVNILSLSRSKEHKNLQEQIHFWELVESFAQNHKPFLRV